jgi:hypothetical protein
VSCLSSSVVILQSPETNHPKPAKPCVEVNLVKTNQDVERPHLAPIGLSTLAYALLWV